MSDTQEPPPVYAVFAGIIDQQTVQRVFQGLSTASQQAVPHVHLLLQSQGGLVADGVCLYNFFRTVPVPVTLYNAGSICSAATLAYLGCPRRATSRLGNFMIHRAASNLHAVNHDVMRAGADSLQFEERRVEAIIHEHVKLSERQCELHRYADVWFSAEQAVEAGIATEIAEFTPPMGAPLYTL